MKTNPPKDFLNPTPAGKQFPLRGEDKTNQNPPLKGNK